MGMDSLLHGLKKGIIRRRGFLMLPDDYVEPIKNLREDVMETQKRRGRPPREVATGPVVFIDMTELAIEPVVHNKSLNPLNDELDFITHYGIHKAAGKRPSFKNKDFNGLVIDGKEIQAADFYECSFDGALFKNCNMQGVQLFDCIGEPQLVNCDTRFSLGL
jgi:hypothetical protein